MRKEADMPSEENNAFIEAFSSMNLVHNQILANVKYDAARQAKLQQQWLDAQRQQFGTYQTSQDNQPASAPQVTQLTNQQPTQGQGLR
ncbi:hypothetical protein [Streptomyces sp. NPDC048489]|uniref:hypothetical protein n=1 Tax=Streptomyces sp. NPDC048489 TaxID=3154504 RepID=UPI0034222167